MFESRMRMGTPGARSLKKKKIAFLLAIIFVLLYYLAGVLYPDGNVTRYRSDEFCFHLPTIKKIVDSNILDAVKDYRTATFPLYHILVSPVYHFLPDDPGMIRFVNLILTFFTAFLMFYFFLKCNQDPPSYNQSIFAFSVSLAFLLSPYVRASALSITTDNLPYLFIISGLIMLYHYDKNRKMILLPLIALMGFSAFYTRQFYIWVPILFFIEFLKLREVSNSSKLLYIISSILLMIPAGYLLAVWGGPVPPVFQTHHEVSNMVLMLPFIFSFVPLYFIPVYLSYFQEIRDIKIKWRWILIIVVSAFLFCFIYMINSFNFGLSAGTSITALVLWSISYKQAPWAFLIVSFLGLATIGYLLFKFPRKNYIWVFALPVFLFSRVFWQRYFDPLIIILIFITMPPSIKEKLAKTKIILLYPLLEFLIFLGIYYLQFKSVGLP